MSRKILRIIFIANTCNNTNPVKNISISIDLIFLAGLCHDLGHGAFSHLFELFIHEARNGYQWCHEKTSIDMLDYIIKENDLMPVFKKSGLNEQDITFVKVRLFN